MRRLAILAEGLSKRYRIGAGQYRLREALAYAVHAPFRRLGRGARERQPLPPHEPADGRWIWALKDISLEVRQGEAVGIIGPNGSGKSTLLKVLSRITAPTAGRAELHGRVSSMLELGTGFHPELTGRENVYFYGAILGIGRRAIDQRLDDIVSFAGVERFVDTPVKFYSSGMYVRLAFAVAAHMEPEILLVDEILAVGDAPFQERCLAVMERVTKQGRTVLLSSHDLTSVARLCSRAIVLVEGRRVADTDAPSAIAAYEAVLASRGGTGLGPALRPAADAQERTCESR